MLDPGYGLHRSLKDHMPVVSGGPSTCLPHMYAARMNVADMALLLKTVILGAIYSSVCFMRARAYTCRMRKLATNEKMLAALCTPTLARHMLTERRRQKAKQRDRSATGYAATVNGASTSGFARGFRKAYAKRRWMLIFKSLRHRLLCADEDAYAGTATDNPLETPMPSWQTVGLQSGRGLML